MRTHLSIYLGHLFVLPRTDEELVLFPAILVTTESHLFASNASPSWYSRGCNFVGWVAEVLSVRGTRTEGRSANKKLLSVVNHSECATAHPKQVPKTQSRTFFDDQQCLF
eukprot:950604-Amphidinium_carterae.1